MEKAFPWTAEPSKEHSLHALFLTFSNEKGTAIGFVLEKVKFRTGSEDEGKPKKNQDIIF